MYINKLSVELNICSIGCLLLQDYVNHLLYTDDIVLISLSAKVLQCFINSCITIGNELNIYFNDSKTVCMTICTKSDQKCKSLFPDIYLNSKNYYLLIFINILDSILQVPCQMIKTSCDKLDLTILGVIWCAVILCTALMI